MTLELPPEFYQNLQERNYNGALEEAQPVTQDFLESRNMPKGTTPAETAKIAMDNFSGDEGGGISGELLNLARAFIGGLTGGDSRGMSQAEIEAARQEAERQKQQNFLKIAALAVAAAVAIYLIAKK